MTYQHRCIKPWYFYVYARAIRRHNASTSLWHVTEEHFHVLWPKCLLASGHKCICKSCKPVIARHLHYSSEKSVCIQQINLLLTWKQSRLLSTPWSSVGFLQERSISFDWLEYWIRRMYIHIQSISFQKEFTASHCLFFMTSCRYVKKEMNSKYFHYL